MLIYEILEKSHERKNIRIFLHTKFTRLMVFTLAQAVLRFTVMLGSQNQESLTYYPVSGRKTTPLIHKVEYMQST